MAESPVDPMIKYVYQGDFGETVQAAVRPIVIIYEVKDYYYDNLNFKILFLKFFITISELIFNVFLLVSKIKPIFVCGSHSS